MTDSNGAPGVTSCSLPLIAVVGPPCAGKTEIGKLSSELGYLHVEWGAFLSELTRGENDSRIERQQALIGQIARLGRSKVMSALLNHVDRQLANGEYIGVALCGARHPVELAYVLGHFEKHRVVLVDSGIDKRFARCVVRGRVGDPTTKFEFIRAEMQEYSLGLARVILDFATDLVDNSDDLECLRRVARHHLENWIHADF